MKYLSRLDVLFGRIIGYRVEIKVHCYNNLIFKQKSQNLKVGLRFFVMIYHVTQS